MKKFGQTLSVVFTGHVKIPGLLADVEIENLTVWGEITDQETQRIKNMFPGSRIMINNKAINLKKTDPPGAGVFVN
ncbi:hypothetical protein FACS1894159_11790 [Bacteroidia bacterium]|nr:hypothetical protein FACS1894159_11790 [Bacteroidia bacterium]